MHFPMAPQPYCGCPCGCGRGARPCLLCQRGDHSIEDPDRALVRRPAPARKVA